MNDETSSRAPSKRPKSRCTNGTKRKRAPGPIDDQDLVKYTGKTRDEINSWAESRPGVGRNQLAGKVGFGSTSGLGGMATAVGYGGWGPNAEPKGANRGMKFPPRDVEAEQKEQKASG
ncbi:hypothetical protein EsDP_00004696 [Epichloe bromicola]|uniref:Uncharacterized protein n=1 Tax=Epichloe bromicola TaxID=79588 RepID=A0ABQ0CSG5_9HYPO